MSGVACCVGPGASPVKMHSQESLSGVVYTQHLPSHPRLIHIENEELLEVTVDIVWEHTVGKVFTGVFKKRTRPRYIHNTSSVNSEETILWDN